MKYYGVKNKRLKEILLYYYAKNRAFVFSMLPGKYSKLRKRNYKYIWSNNEDLCAEKYDNSIPSGGICSIYSVEVSDLIRREDIKKLLNGVRLLIERNTSNKFLNTHSEGIGELCKRIDHMDSSLFSWFESIDCGIFELKTKKVTSIIDYFGLRVCNINSGFLALIFSIKFSDEFSLKLNKLIASNYKENHGYAIETMSMRKEKLGLSKNYSNVSFNRGALKADKIFEMINCAIWEFMEELNDIFPFVLQGKGIMPPRIETYSTNLDYHNENHFFWYSVGVDKNYGEFIDENHKMFFNFHLSGRYENTNIRNRLIYIFKDDDIEAGQLKSIKDKVYFHLKDLSIEYFKFMFLDILVKNAGIALVKFKHKFDRIKLKKNSLKSLLKLKYKLSLELDDYNRIVRDDIWDISKNKIEKVYDKSQLGYRNRNSFWSYQGFYETILAEMREFNKDVDVIKSITDEKKNILQNLYDYKNTKRNFKLNILMAIIAAITLFFVIYPQKAEEFAVLLSKLFNILKNR